MELTLHCDLKVVRNTGLALDIGKLVYFGVPGFTCKLIKFIYSLLYGVTGVLKDLEVTGFVW